MKRLLFLAVALIGCRYWYTPVPVATAIGEEKTVLAGDTMRSYRDERFEVYGPNAEAVYDGYEQLNRAYRAFARHFGSDAPRLAVLLANDTLVQLDSATLHAFAQRGFTFLRYIRPHGARRVRYGTVAYGGVQWPVAPTAARLMLTQFALSHLSADAPHSDTVALARFPAWYRTAIMHLIGEAGGISNDIEYVREQPHALLSLSELVTYARPLDGDVLLDPSRRGDADGFARIFASQSSTVAQFLVEREGPDVLRHLAEGYLAQRSFADMIEELPATGRQIPELEQRWRVWLSMQVD